MTYYEGTNVNKWVKSVLICANCGKSETKTDELFIYTDPELLPPGDHRYLGTSSYQEACEFAQSLEPCEMDIQSIRFRWNVYQSTLEDENK